MIQAKL